jgi:hypothetical protein
MLIQEINVFLCFFSLNLLVSQLCQEAEVMLGSLPSRHGFAGALDNKVKEKRKIAFADC